MTPKPEHVEKAREIVSAWIEAHWPVDDPTPKDRSELDLVDRIALALSDAEKASGIESLPKTKDGKVILPGMSMHFSSSIETTVLAVWFDGTIDLQSHHNGIPTNDWKRLRAEHFGYSTREAALSSLPAARKDQA